MTLHCCTDNTMQCDSSLVYIQHNALWLFITVQTTQCNVALRHSTDNTMQCGSSSPYRQHNAMWLFIAVQTTQSNVALHHCADNTLQCGSSSSYRQHNAMYPSINAQQHIFWGTCLCPNAMYLSVNANHSMHSSPFPQPPGILVPACTSLETTWC